LSTVAVLVGNIRRVDRDLRLQHVRALTGLNVERLINVRPHVKHL